jgi:hypothetical protein
MEGTFVVWMIGVVVLVAAQMIEYVFEAKASRSVRVGVRSFARDLPPGDIATVSHPDFGYEQAA